MITSCFQRLRESGFLQSSTHVKQRTICLQRRKSVFNEVFRDQEQRTFKHILTRELWRLEGMFVDKLVTEIHIHQMVFGWDLRKLKPWHSLTSTKSRLWTHISSEHGCLCRLIFTEEMGGKWSCQNGPWFTGVPLRSSSQKRSRNSQERWAYLSNEKDPPKYWTQTSSPYRLKESLVHDVSNPKY